MYHPEAGENFAESAKLLVYQGKANFIFVSNSTYWLEQIN